MAMAFDSTEGDDDDALLRRFAAGDDLAARALALRHTGRVLSLATRMLADRHEAEDVTQEVMLRMWQAAPDWTAGRAQLSTWLYRVTSNLCIDRLRRKRAAEPLTEEPADPRPDADHVLIARERQNALQTAIGNLPERQQLAVTLRHLEELPNPQIAEIMEISVEAVESLLARGRRALAADPELGRAHRKEAT